MSFYDSDLGRVLVIEGIGVSPDAVGERCPGHWNACALEIVQPFLGLRVEVYLLGTI
jgi:hypothetical protein